MKLKTPVWFIINAVVKNPQTMTTKYVKNRVGGGAVPIPNPATTSSPTREINWNIHGPNRQLRSTITTRREWTHMLFDFALFCHARLSENPTGGELIKTQHAVLALFHHAKYLYFLTKLSNSKTYFVIYWTNTRLVCTYLNAFFMEIPNIVTRYHNFKKFEHFVKYRLLTTTPVTW